MAGHMRVHHGIEAPLTNLEPIEIEPIEIEPIETPAEPEPDSESDSMPNGPMSADTWTIEYESSDDLYEVQSEINNYYQCISSTDCFAYYEPKGNFEDFKYLVRYQAIEADIDTPIIDLY
jgi:hypothetical protein